MNYSAKSYAKKAREAAAEGIVLLENRGRVLPLLGVHNVAVFGRSQFHYYKSGTGSGGMVNTGYVTGVLEALREEKDITINAGVLARYEAWLKDHPFDTGVGWAAEPWYQEEMPVTDELLAAASASDTALVIIGRTAGEDKDNSAARGSYLLTECEEEMLQKVCSTFDRTVVLLNVGNIIDMSWVDRYHPAAVLYIWQGGQEGGNGVLDVLTGRTTPSGKLPDTIPFSIEDIPSTARFGQKDLAVYEEDIYVGYRYFETFAPDLVRYPFGFGLSYTTFSIEKTLFSVDRQEKLVTMEARVTNTGSCAGKEVLQLYVEAPQGVLGKPKRSLVSFAKTSLLQPGESQSLLLTVPFYYFSSYDDRGDTGIRSAYLLESGTYRFVLGTDCRSVLAEDEFILDELLVLEQLSEMAAPEQEFAVLRPAGSAEDYKKTSAPVHTRTVSYDMHQQSLAPALIPQTENLGYQLSDVEDGIVSMEAFIAQFTVEDLLSISRGEGMCSSKVTPGIAGAIGGVTESLKQYGIPIAGCADGPSGIRMDCGTIAFAMPNGTLLASTFNETLCRELYEWEGLELRKNKIDMLLGPGMNIHRNPLNGRNFEYFSEDPLLTGKMASAALRGMQKYDVSGVIKHFACNNQETNRHGVESVVSERALREIYLKGFEIAVKEGGASAVMTTYNPMNGYWTASNIELIEGILRGEWGFRGIVMTDWWAKGNFTGEDGAVVNTAAKAQAGNDLFMVNADASDQDCDNSMECVRSKRVSLADYQRNAMHICSFLMHTPVYDRMRHGLSQLDHDLKDLVLEGDGIITREIPMDLRERNVIPGEELLCMRDDINRITLSVYPRGLYRLEITCRASADAAPLAQIPLTIFRNREIWGQITLPGSRKDWQTFCFDSEVPFFMTSAYIKLRFGMGGMEVRDVKMVLVEDQEEEIGKRIV